MGGTGNCCQRGPDKIRTNRNFPRLPAERAFFDFAPKHPPRSSRSAMPGGMLLRGLVLVSAARAAATVQVTVPGEANGKTADLRCAGFGAIAVHSARYGDPPGCATPRDALEEVTTMCGGRTSCAFPVCCCSHLGPAFAGFNVGVRLTPHPSPHPTPPQSSPKLLCRCARRRARQVWVTRVPVSRKISRWCTDAPGEATSSRCSSSAPQRVPLPTLPRSISCPCLNAAVLHRCRRRVPARHQDKGAARDGGPATRTTLAGGACARARWHRVVQSAGPGSVG